VLQNITVLGIKEEPTNSQVNGIPFEGYYFNKTEQVILSVITNYIILLLYTYLHTFKHIYTRVILLTVHYL